MSRDPLEPFVRDWNRWLDRPPRRRAEEALDGVFETSLRRRRLRHLAAVAALAAAFGGAFLWPRSGEAPAPLPEAPRPAPLDEDVVLLWLDRQTPLYMSLRRSDAEKGDPR